MLSRSRFTEESVVRFISTTDGFVAGHLTVGLDSMLQTVQFPTTIPNLNSGLADVNWKTLTLQQQQNKQIYRHRIENNISLYINLNPVLSDVISEEDFKI